MQYHNYRLDIYRLPEISVTTDNGIEVLVKSGYDESPKYGRIRTYMLYFQYGNDCDCYRVMVCNWNGKYSVPAGKIFYINARERKVLDYLGVASPEKRANAVDIIGKYEEVVASHRRKNPVVATTANTEDEAYTEEIAV